MNGKYTPPLNTLVWVRPNQMGGWDGQYRQNPTLWGDTGVVHVNGFAEGGAGVGGVSGDCWFLAAAAAIAE